MTWDDFFYYGQQDIAVENENDLQIGLLQPSRTFLYNRQDSVGIKENLPVSFTLYIMLRYLVVKWIAYRNNYISRGVDGSRDRRIAASQDTVNVEFPAGSTGTVDLNVFYANYIDYQNVRNVSVPFEE